MTRPDRLAPDPGLPLKLPLALQGDPPRLHDGAGRLLALFDPPLPATAATGAGALANGALHLAQSLAGPQRARLFWPPRPAALSLFVDDEVEPRPLAADFAYHAHQRLLIVDPRTRAALSIETGAAGAGELSLRGLAGVDALELEVTARSGGAPALALRFDAAAFAALNSDRRDRIDHAIAQASGSKPLGLNVVAASARLQVVSWDDDHPADEREQEQLAQLVTSRRTGTTLLLAGPDGDATGSEVPRALSRLTDSAPPFAIELDGNRAEVRAPIGRGRIVRGAAATWTPRLADASGARAVEAAIEAALIAQAEASTPLATAPPDAIGATATPLRPRADAPQWRELHVALPACAAAFRHELDGGERVQPALPGAAQHLWPTVGRLVRGAESFELAPQVGGVAPQRHLLVIERLTLAADAGTLLRVELDDEDLGPWRLGGPSPEGAELDSFSIPADLFAGRDRFRLTLRASAGEQVALRWRFFLEAELNGSWLTDLEWSPPLANHGKRIDLAEQLRGRSLTLRGGESTTTELPRGYRELQIGAVLLYGVAESPAALEVRLDDEAPTRIEWVAEEVVVPLGSAHRLTLTAVGTASTTVTLRDPRLLR